VATLPSPNGFLLGMMAMIKESRKMNNPIQFNSTVEI